jgi:hypothetical protein
LEHELRELGVRPSRAAAHLHDELVGSTRQRREDIVIVGGPPGTSVQPAFHGDGEWPYGRVMDALAELRRDYPTLSFGSTPIAVVIMS